MRGNHTWSAQLLARGLSTSRSSTTRVPAPAPALRNFFTSSQAPAKARISSRSLNQSPLFLFRPDRFTLSGRFRSLRLKSDKTLPSQQPNPTPNLGSPEPALSLSQRLRKLSREYGWAGFGVYMALTALDFPFCFLAVRSLGTERIGHYEHVVVEAVMSVVRIPFPNLGQKTERSPVSGELETTARESELGMAEDIEEAEAKNNGAGASLWTELALAYAIHKSFIFIRVPLAAAITPKVVKTLRGWGWNIGKRKPKSA